MKQSQERSAEMVKIPFWRSLRFKFALSYLVLIIFALGILNTYPVFAAQEMVFRAKQSSLQNQATIIASAISSLGELTSEGVAQVMDMLDENGMTRVMITDPDGLILYDTEESDGTPKYALIQELALALRGKDVCVWSYSAGAFRTTTAIPVMYRNAIIGGIYLYDYDGVFICGNVPLYYLNWDIVKKKRVFYSNNNTKKMNDYHLISTLAKKGEKMLKDNKLKEKALFVVTTYYVDRSIDINYSLDVLNRYYDISERKTASTYHGGIYYYELTLE